MDRGDAIAAIGELVPGGLDRGLRRIAEELDLLARWKYDRYEGYGPGRRFWEHALGWLRSLDPSDRAPALRLIGRRLVFVSRDELIHLVRRAYPDHVRPALLRRVAAEVGVQGPPFGQLAHDPRFAQLLRRLVVVGLSDGAQLDLLRRAMPELASDRFVLEHRTLSRLPAAEEARHTIAVDDFSGTGGSLIRREGGRFEGRLTELPEHAAGSLLLYVASQRAAEHLRRTVPQALPGWDVIVVQELPDPAAADATDAAAALRILDRHYGVKPSPSTKGGTNLGYRGGELPLVLHHNTPNDALALLWARPRDGRAGPALFPRYERLQARRD
jgi:hypothetical protein